MPEESLITEEGKKNLAAMLFEVMQREGISSQEGFAEWLSTRSGVTVKENRVFRLLKGRYDDATITLLIPIIKAKILQLPNGSFYTFDDLVDLLCGVLDPKTGERHHHYQNGAN